MVRFPVVGFPFKLVLTCNELHVNTLGLKLSHDKFKHEISPSVVMSPALLIVRIPVPIFSPPLVKIRLFPEMPPDTFKAGVEPYVVPELVLKKLVVIDPDVFTTLDPPSVPYTW